MRIPLSLKRLLSSPWFFFVLSILVLLPGINRGFILDEYKTYMLTDLDWRNLLHDRFTSGHFPTYFIIIKSFSQWVGNQEWQLRLPGVLMASLTVFPCFAIALRVGGLRAAVITTWILVFHQLMVWSGQTARPYSGMIFFQFLLVWALLKWLAGGQKKHLVVLGLATLGGLSFMPLFATVPLAMIVVLLARYRVTRQRRQLSASLVMASVIVLSLIPSVVLAFTQSKLNTEVAEEGAVRFQNPKRIIDAVSLLVYGEYPRWAPGIFQYIAVIIFALCFVQFRRYIPRRAAADALTPDIPAYSLIVSWLVFPIAVLLVGEVVTAESLISHTRYKVPAIGATIMILGLGCHFTLNAPWPAWRRHALCAAAIVPIMITTMAWWRQGGEGVQQVVERVCEVTGGVPDQLAGHVRWFRFEIPGEEVSRRELMLERAELHLNKPFVERAIATGNDVETFVYDKKTKDIEPLRAELERWAQGKPFWLFAYIKPGDPLDKVSKNPPAGYRTVRRISCGDARAYELVPVTP